MTLRCDNEEPWKTKATNPHPKREHQTLDERGSGWDCGSGCNTRRGAHASLMPPRVARSATCKFRWKPKSKWATFSPMTVAYLRLEAVGDTLRGGQEITEEGVPDAALVQRTSYQELRRLGFSTAVIFGD